MIKDLNKMKLFPTSIVILAIVSLPIALVVAGVWIVYEKIVEWIDDVWDN